MSDAVRIVYDDEEIRVLWRPGRVPFLLISFGDLISLADDVRFFASGPVEAADLSCLGFMAKHGNWFPASNMAHAIAAAKDILASYQRRIAYGGSMGGYAALKFSRLLGATQVISLCPQWSIDPSECEGRDPGWQEYFVDSLRGMGVRTSDVAGDVFIFRDPRSALDSFHAAMIVRAYPTAQMVDVPMVGHAVTTVFAGTNNLLEIIAAAEAGARPRLQAIAHRLRRDSYYRKERLFSTSLQRRPLAALQALLSRGTRDPHARELGGKYMSAALRQLAPSIHRELLKAYVEMFRAHVQEPAAAARVALLYSVLSGRNLFLRTFHGAILLYDSLEDRVFSGPPDPASLEPWILPVRISIAGASASLFIEQGGVRVALAPNTDGSVGASVFNGRHPGSGNFEVTSEATGAFSLGQHGKYLSAAPNGLLACHASEVNGWELFRLS